MAEEITKLMTPDDYILLIDAQYLKAKAAGLSRSSVEWGKWSREMNLELRERIKAHDPEKPKLKFIMIYLVLRSQLLDFHYRKPCLGRLKRKNWPGKPNSYAR